MKGPISDYCGRLHSFVVVHVFANELRFIDTHILKGLVLFKTLVKTMVPLSH